MSKKYLIIIFVVLAALVAIDISIRVFLKVPANSSEIIVINGNNNAPLVGGDRDSHGCIGSAGYSWCEVKRKCLRPWEEKCDIAASFNCPDGKIINAVFETAPQDQVSLDLSDGRKIILPHALSADGARYANANESFVFWNKESNAFIQENGKETFSACVSI